MQPTAWRNLANSFRGAFTSKIFFKGKKARKRKRLIVIIDNYEISGDCWAPNLGIKKLKTRRKSKKFCKGFNSRKGDYTGLIKKLARSSLRAG